MNRSALPGHARLVCSFTGPVPSGAEDFGDIANAMASAGIVTLVPAKRNDNYTVLHRDYPRFAREYGRSLDVLRGRIGVDPAKTGIYARSRRHLDRHDSNLKTARHCLCRTHIRTGVQWT